jgi:hypothetical protein
MLDAGYWMLDRKTGLLNGGIKMGVPNEPG